MDSESDFCAYAAKFLDTVFSIAKSFTAMVCPIEPAHLEDESSSEYGNFVCSESCTEVEESTFSSSAMADTMTHGEARFHCYENPLYDDHTFEAENNNQWSLSSVISRQGELEHKINNSKPPESVGAFELQKKEHSKGSVISRQGELERKINNIKPPESVGAFELQKKKNSKGSVISRQGELKRKINNSKPSESVGAFEFQKKENSKAFTKPPSKVVEMKWRRSNEMAKAESAKAEPVRKVKGEYTYVFLPRGVKWTKSGPSAGASSNLRSRKEFSERGSTAFSKEKVEGRRERRQENKRKLVQKTWKN